MNIKFRIFTFCPSLINALELFMEAAYRGETPMFQEKMKARLSEVTEQDLRDPVRMFELIYGSMLHGYGVKDGSCSFMWHSFPTFSVEGTFQLYAHDGYEREASLFVCRFPEKMYERVHGRDWKIRDYAYRLMIGDVSREHLLERARKVSASSWSVKIGHWHPEYKHDLSLEEAVATTDPDFSASEVVTP